MSDPLTLVPLCDHVPDWQPRILLGMVEVRSVSVKNTTTTILPRKFQSSYSSAVEFSLQHERLGSLRSVASEYSTLVARKGMSIFPNGPSRATLQSLHIGLLR